VGSLFDNDEDVEIASTRSRRTGSRHDSVSSRASRPLTSESDGMFGLGEDEVDDEENAEELPPRSSKQRTRVSLSKRDAALKSEVRSLLNISFG
jgi:hypothetical protein